MRKTLDIIMLPYAKSVKAVTYCYALMNCSQSPPAQAPWPDNFSLSSEKLKTRPFYAPVFRPFYAPADNLISSRLRPYL